MRIGKEPTSDVEAYQLYLLGRHCLARYTFEGMNKAIEYFEAAEALESARRAVEFDPHYDRARATLGWAYILKGMNAEGLGLSRRKP